MRRFFSFLVLVAIVLFFIFALPLVHAQDNFVPQCATQASCQLNQFGPISWANGNQVWRFVPINPSVSLRIWIRNRNTTSAHTTQTVNVFITDETTAPNFTLSQDRWIQAVVENNSITGAQCNNVAINNPAAIPGGKGTCYSNGMYASQIAVQITGAAAAAGSPDTFDIGVVQQVGYASGPQPGQDTSTGFTLPLAGTGCLFAGCPLVMNWASIFGSATATGPLRITNADGSLLVGGINGAIGTAGASGFVTASSLNGTTTSTLDSVLPGMHLVSAPAIWSATDQGTAKQCSASVAASATGKRHFVTGCTVCVAAGATPQTPIFANLRDGATGAGTIKWAGAMGSITNAYACVHYGGMTDGVIPGTANTAATCELSAASAATVACTANLEGYDQ